MSKKNGSVWKIQMIKLALLARPGCAYCGRIGGKREFHHRPGEIKLFNVCCYPGHTLEEIAKEIAKCDVICRECHTKTKQWNPWNKGLFGYKKPIGYNRT